MIIAVFPFEFYLFRDKVAANFVVDICFMSLTVLETSLNPVHLAVFLSDYFHAKIMLFLKRLT